MKTTRSYHLRESQVQAIEDLARESVVREDVPEMSKSDVMRRLLDTALEADNELTELMTESTLAQHREERFMEDEGDLRNKRSGFETQVKRHFKRRFENGYRPEQLEEFAVNMRMKARCYWPEDLGDDYTERRQEALAYVDALLAEAKEAAETSEYDPLDPSEVFDSYAGVEDGRGREQFESVVDDARRRVESTSGVVDPEAVARALSKQHGIPETVAREAVEAARGGA